MFTHDKNKHDLKEDADLVLGTLMGALKKGVEPVDLSCELNVD